MIQVDAAPASTMEMVYLLAAPAPQRYTFIASNRCITFQEIGKCFTFLKSRMKMCTGENPWGSEPAADYSNN
jgi:hypothetical protein